MTSNILHPFPSSCLLRPPSIPQKAQQICPNLIIENKRIINVLCLCAVKTRSYPRLTRTCGQHSVLTNVRPGDKMFRFKSNTFFVHSFLVLVVQSRAAYGQPPLPAVALTVDFNRSSICAFVSSFSNGFDSSSSGGAEPV